MRIIDVLVKNILKKSLNTNEILDVSQIVSGIYSITIDGAFASKFINILYIEDLIFLDKTST